MVDGAIQVILALDHLGKNLVYPTIFLAVCRPVVRPGCHRYGLADRGASNALDQHQFPAEAHAAYASSGHLPAQNVAMARSGIMANQMHLDDPVMPVIGQPEASATFYGRPRKLNDLMGSYHDALVTLNI